jgi:hypothetical protein
VTRQYFSFLDFVAKMGSFGVLMYLIGSTLGPRLARARVDALLINRLFHLTPYDKDLVPKL